MNLVWLFEYSQNDFNMSNFQGYFQLIVNIIKIKLDTHSFRTGRLRWDSQFGSSFFSYILSKIILRFPLVRFYGQSSCFKSNFSYIGKTWWTCCVISWKHCRLQLWPRSTAVWLWSFHFHFSQHLSHFSFFGGGHFLYVIDLEYNLSPYCATVNLGDKWNLLSGTLKQSKEF